MSETRRFPIDFDGIQKGDVIPAEVVEEYSGCKRGTQRFALAMLSFRERVVRESADRGKHFTVAIVRGQLRVLTDEEAAAYNARTFKFGFRRSRRSLRRLLRVNPELLTDQQRADHERNVLVFGKMLQAASAMKKKLLAIPHERSVPGLPASV